MSSIVRIYYLLRDFNFKKSASLIVLDSKNQKYVVTQSKYINVKPSYGTKLKIHRTRIKLLIMT